MARTNSNKKLTHTTKFLPLLLMVSLVSIFYGCVNEDLADCPEKGAGVILKYRYDLNMSYTDKFATEVKKLQTFIFDADGVLIDSIKPFYANTSIQHGIGHQLDLLPGEYTALTWASSDNLYQDYHMSKVNNFPDLSLSELAIGQTNISEMRMFLNYTNSQTSKETAQPNKLNFDDLYHGLVQNFVVAKNEYIEVITPLVKNTNTIKVIITGLSYLNPTVNPSDFDIKLRSRNGHYTYNNNTFEPAHLLNYEPFDSEVKDNQIISSVKTLRLTRPEVDPYKGELMLLDVVYTPHNLNICKQFDVVDLILSAKIPARDGQGNFMLDNNGAKIYVQPSLEYLDREDTFEIKFEITKSEDGLLLFTVYVNDWKITNIYPVK